MSPLSYDDSSSSMRDEQQCQVSSSQPTSLLQGFMKDLLDEAARNAAATGSDSEDSSICSSNSRSSRVRKCRKMKVNIVSDNAMSSRPDENPHATSTRVLRRIVSLNNSNHRDDRWSNSNQSLDYASAMAADETNEPTIERTSSFLNKQPRRRSSLQRPSLLRATSLPCRGLTRTMSNASSSEISPKIPSRKDYFDKFSLKFTPDFIRRSTRNLFLAAE